MIGGKSVPDSLVFFHIFQSFLSQLFIVVFGCVLIENYNAIFMGENIGIRSVVFALVCHQSRDQSVSDCSHDGWS